MLAIEHCALEGLPFVASLSAPMNIESFACGLTLMVCEAYRQVPANSTSAPRATWSGFLVSPTGSLIQ